jgi:hypothetical protein
MSQSAPDPGNQCAPVQQKNVAVPSPAEAAVPGAVGVDLDPADALKKLTAAEQMALYEKELRENDWGHQPC